MATKKVIIEDLVSTLAEFNLNDGEVIKYDQYKFVNRIDGKGVQLQPPFPEDSYIIYLSTIRQLKNGTFVYFLVNDI